MPDTFPTLTLLLGPSSQHGMALNATVRRARHALARNGLTAYPLRLAGPAVKSVIDSSRDAEDRQHDFDRILGDAPAFYSAPRFLSLAMDFRPGLLCPSVEKGWPLWPRLWGT